MMDFESTDDERLLSLFAETADEAYFNELHRRYRRNLIEFVIRIIVKRDYGVAEDIVQQTFLKVHTTHDTFDPAMKFRPWLYSIAANLTVNHKIAAKRRDMISLDALVQGKGRPHGEISFDPQDHREIEPTVSLLDGEQTDHLRELVSRLRPSQRDVMERLYFQGMTSEEAAADLGIPLGTVKSQLSRSLQSLRGWAAEDSAVSEAA